MSFLDSIKDPRPERRSRYHEADVVVVGAGIFGCAIAYALADQDRSVLLLERWMQEPDRIVGELLQPGGVAALRKLGLEKCLDNIDSIPCNGFHVTYHGEEVVIPYPEIDHTGKVNVRIESHNDSYLNGSANSHPKKTDAKRPQGRSFHHGRFVANLRRACQAHPNITVVETEVTGTITGKLFPEVLGVEARTYDPETQEKKPDAFFAPFTIIADGYSSKFRKQLLGTAPIVRSKFYALELIDCPFPPAQFGHVVIGSAYPVLLYQIGTHETRALIDVPVDLPAASPANGGVRGYITNVVVPSLPASVQPSFAAALADGKIPRSMPNSWLPPVRQEERLPPGVAILGDAFNMRHPLTGGGMTVAFNDAVLLASLLEPVPSLADRPAVKTAMASFHSQRRSLSSIINVLAMALYRLFAAQDRQLRALQRGCFRYFQWGFTDEPVGMLGGLLRTPSLLAYHFFTVAFVALWLNACEVIGSFWGLWKAPLALADAVLILWRASMVFLPVLWKEYQ